MSAGGWLTVTEGISVLGRLGCDRDACSGGLMGVGGL